MYGDTEVMLRHAAALREQGADVRAIADQLVARTEAIGWAGRAADSMRERIKDRAGHLRAVAARHDTAAATLDRHVREIDRRQERIASIERRALRLVSEARSRVAQSQATYDDLTLTGFDAPPTGHRDWLTAELPGL